VVRTQVKIRTVKEVIIMPRGLGFGRGFGFRGSSPPWPYVGRGRGGLPRCAYPGLYEGLPPAGAWDQPYYGQYPGYGTYPYARPTSKEEELDILQEEANSIKARLEWVEGRIKDLEGVQE
jgi:hypothetical protein